MFLYSCFPRPSSALTGGVGIDELLRQLKQLFRPDQEDMGTFLARVTRLVMALKSLGHEASAQESVGGGDVAAAL